MNVRILSSVQDDAVLKDVPPFGAGELGKPVTVNGSVVQWPANDSTAFGDLYRKPDMVVPDFAWAATLRIEFTQADVTHVLNFRVIRGWGYLDFTHLK